MAAALRRAMETAAGLPSFDFPAVEGALASLAKQGASLDGEELAAVGRSILSSLKLRRYVLKALPAERERGRACAERTGCVARAEARGHRTVHSGPQRALPFDLQDGRSRRPASREGPARAGRHPRPDPPAAGGHREGSPCPHGRGDGPDMVADEPARPARRQAGAPPQGPVPRQGSGHRARAVRQRVHRVHRAALGRGDEQRGGAGGGALPAGDAPDPQGALGRGGGPSRRPRRHERRGRGARQSPRPGPLGRGALLRAGSARRRRLPSRAGAPSPARDRRGAHLHRRGRRRPRADRHRTEHGRQDREPEDRRPAGGAQPVRHGGAGRARHRAAALRRHLGGHRRRAVDLAEPLHVLGARAEPRPVRRGCRAAVAGAPRRAGRRHRPPGGRGARHGPARPLPVRGRARDLHDPPRNPQELRRHPRGCAERLDGVRPGIARADVPDPHGGSGREPRAGDRTAPEHARRPSSATPRRTSPTSAPTFPSW